MFRRMFMLLLAGAEAVWRTVVKTGTGMIVANDTTENQPVKVELQGWTEQNTTIGAQLFDKSNVETDLVLDANGSLSSGKGYFTSDFVEVTVGEKYYISKTRSKRGKFFDESKKPIQTENFTDFSPEYGVSVLIPDGVKYIRFSGFTEGIDTIMVNKGSTALPYEPYTGGQPSPSPEYPQEIVSAGKYDEGTQKYQCEVKLTGANIFLYDKDFSVYTKSDKFFDKFVLSDYKVEAEVNSQFTTLKSPVLTLKPNTKYTVSAVLSSSSANRSSGMIRLFKNLNVSDSQKTLCTVQRPSNPTLNEEYEASVTFTTNDMSDTPECYLQCDCSWNETEFPVKSTFKNIMITEVEGADYEPYYTPQTVTLTSDRPLTKWDKLEKRNGVWGWVYKSNEVVLDGSEDEAISLYVGSEREGNSFLVNIPDSVGGYKTSRCDKYRNINGSWNGFHKGEYAIYSDHFRVATKNRYFRPPSAEVQTVEQWRTWLSENPLTLWYETAEETFIPLSESEQEAMNALYTFRPTTVFSNDNEMFMQIEYQTKRIFGLKKPAGTTSMFNFGIKWSECNRIVLRASGMNDITRNMLFCGGPIIIPYIAINSSKVISSGLSNFEWSGYSNEIKDGRKFEMDFRFPPTSSNPVCNIWDSNWSKQIIYHEILFYKDDTLLADFIPDTSNADRMYNKVNGQYITASELGVYELVEV